MKILLINNFFGNYGGAEIMMHETASILKSKGHEVFFFATKSKNTQDYEYSKYFPDYIHYSSLPKIDFLFHIWKSFYNPDAEKKLDLFIKKIKPDVAHCNNITYDLTPSVLNACYRNNIPVVMTLHDATLMCPSMTMRIKSGDYCKNELCVKGNPIHCLINKCFFGNFMKSAAASAEFLFRKIHRLYDKIQLFICPSQAILSLAARSGINRGKLVHLNNFVDDSYLKKQPVYSNKGYFLYVGRLAEEKGLNYLLEAMSKLPRHIGLHIVGTGPDEANLKDYAVGLELSNVVFTGFKTGKELEDEYKGCIATILPCNWFEIFGLTILESFAFGKPVIASHIGGIPEIVENEWDGITFEPKNVDALAEAIEKLYCNNDLAVEMGKNGRTKAEIVYNSEIYYAKLIRIYESL